jgi:predicted membrane channel-forming protein YqfA (hemolysin III family)
MAGKWFANRGQIVQTVFTVISACVAIVALYFVLKSNNSLPRVSVVMYVSVGVFVLLIGIIIGRRLGPALPSEPPGKSIQPLMIKSAKYGVGGDRYKDVTPQVKAFVKNNRLNFLVGNSTLEATSKAGLFRPCRTQVSNPK